MWKSCTMQRFHTISKKNFMANQIYTEMLTESFIPTEWLAWGIIQFVRCISWSGQWKAYIRPGNLVLSFGQVLSPCCFQSRPQVFILQIFLTQKVEIFLKQKVEILLTQKVEAMAYKEKCRNCELPVKNILCASGVTSLDFCCNWQTLSQFP